MKKLALIIGLAACLDMPTQAAEVRVFNLPLGGRLDRKLPKCSLSAKPNLDFCWIDEPLGPNSKRKSATVGQPTSALPKWVSPGLARIGIDQNGEIYTISVEVDPDSEKEAISSISQRFGQPNDTIRASGARATTWKRQELEIKVVCDYTKCFSEFLSAARVAERDDAWKNQKPRPATP